MNRRDFMISTAALALSAGSRLGADTDHGSHKLPVSDAHYKMVKSYVEDVPVSQYHWAPERAYEAFRDLKFGVRVHWGIYSIYGKAHESWPYLDMTHEQRMVYNDLYKTWNPVGFDADGWVSLFQDCGAKMFSFTSKHHEGFSMFDTKTRVRSRANWTAAGGPRMEGCDLAYSIMETPFKRDVIKELTDAAHRRQMKIDLYFSHPDWYDADFRPYSYHPLQTPSSMAMHVDGVKPGPRYTVVAESSHGEVRRMMARHRAQLSELLTNYGTIDMMCLDQWLGPAVWPELRKTMIHLRKLAPDTMFRARGIGNYGDYYTPEGFVPGSKENSDVPWFVIYPLGSSFSYEADAAKYKGPSWIVHNLVDAVAKGGNFMVGVGPNGNGEFHPEAVKQLHAVGGWLKVNGEGIYATRARDGVLWSEGKTIRYTRTKDNRYIYAMATEWPGKTLNLTTVKPRAGSPIHMLGYSDALKWSTNSAIGTTIVLPENLQDEDHRPCQFAWTFRLEA